MYNKCYCTKKCVQEEFMLLYRVRKVRGRISNKRCSKCGIAIVSTSNRCFCCGLTLKVKFNKKGI